jgi:hypothetical protein
MIDGWSNGLCSFNSNSEVEQKPQRTVILSAAKDLRSPFGRDTYEQLQRSFAALRMTETAGMVQLRNSGSTGLPSI